MSCAPEGWEREGEGRRNGERKEQTEEEERDGERWTGREGERGRKKGRRLWTWGGMGAKKRVACWTDHQEGVRAEERSEKGSERGRRK